MVRKTYNLTEKDRRYLKTISQLERIIEQHGYEDNRVSFDWRSQESLDRFILVFGWLNKQQWYQNHHHLVKEYIDSIVQTSE